MKHAVVSIAALVLVVALAVASSGCCATQLYRRHDMTTAALLTDMAIAAVGVGLQVHAHQPTPEDPGRGNFSAEDIAGISITLGTLVPDLVAGALWSPPWPARR